jgi:predicted transcriptional regulator
MPRSGYTLRKAGELTVEEVAAALGRSEACVLAYLKEDRRTHPRLRGIKRGGAWFVARTELDRFRATWPDIRPDAAEACDA